MDMSDGDFGAKLRGRHYSELLDCFLGKNAATNLGCFSGSCISPEQKYPIAVF